MPTDELAGGDGWRADIRSTSKQLAATFNLESTPLADDRIGGLSSRRASRNVRVRRLQRTR
jgi:hypothetical protein